MDPREAPPHDDRAEEIKYKPIEGPLETSGEGEWFGNYKGDDLNQKRQKKLELFQWYYLLLVSNWPPQVS